MMMNIVDQQSHLKNETPPSFIIELKYCVSQLLSLALTFDLNEHELFIGHGTVVGTLLRCIHTSQTHTAEVFFTGQSSKCNLRETAVLIHYEREEKNKERDRKSMNS